MGRILLLCICISNDHDTSFTYFTIFQAYVNKDEQYITQVWTTCFLCTLQCPHGFDTSKNKFLLLGVLVHRIGTSGFKAILVHERFFNGNSHLRAQCTQQIEWSCSARILGFLYSSPASLPHAPCLLSAPLSSSLHIRKRALNQFQRFIRISIHVGKIRSKDSF